MTINKTTNNPQAVHVEAVLKHDEISPEAIGGWDLGRSHYKRPQFIGTVLATCLSQMSGYLSFSVPANILTLINADLNGGNNITWVAVVWTLGFAVSLPLVGRLSDAFGRRWFYIGCTALTLIGNIVAATARTLNVLIGGIAIIGLSAAGQLSFNVVLGELVVTKDRGPFNALVLATSTPFSIFAPVVARGFQLHTSERWRWIYYLGIILNVVALALWYFFYHPPHYRMLHVNGRSRLNLLKNMDWIGIFLFSGGLTIFLIGLNWGGTSYPWDSARVLATLLVGVGTLIGFCFWEAFSPTGSVYIPMRLFRNIPYDALVICASVGAMIYYSMTVLWPTLIGSLWLTDETMIGWYSCFVGGGLIFGQVTGGIGHKYIPRMKMQMIVGSVIMVAFVGSLASVNPDSLHRSCAFIFLGATGAGYIESLCLSSIALVWDPSDFGLVANAMGCIRTAAGAIATSLYSSILASEYRKYMPRYVTPAVTEVGLPPGSLPSLFEALQTGNFSLVPNITPQVVEAAVASNKRAYARNFEMVFEITLIFGGIMIIASFFVPNVDHYLTDDVPRRLQDRNQGRDEEASESPQEQANVGPPRVSGQADEKQGQITTFSE